METKTWDRRFLKLAQEVATWSKDPDHQVGAILTLDRRIVSTGFNGFPIGVPDRYDGITKEEKLALTIHAEHNAILGSGLGVVNGFEFTLYTTMAPCLACCIVIAQTGIGRLVAKYNPPHFRWNAEQRQGEAMLIGLGVAYDVIVED
jgi:dCMP deaminase